MSYEEKRGTLAFEFPDYDMTDFPAIPKDWEGSHWHNDICPSYMARQWPDDHHIRVWVDYRDPDKRELGGPRFSASFGNDTGADNIVETDDWNELLAKVAAFVRPDQN